MTVLWIAVALGGQVPETDSADICSGIQVVRPEDVGDDFDWQHQSPLDFLEMLKTRSAYAVAERHTNWVREEHIPALMQLLDSEEKCGQVLSVLSSVYTPGPSTIGNEAAFLIKGYQQGYYPPALNSLDPNATHNAQQEPVAMGRVLYPDGTPAPGAEVTIETACDSRIVLIDEQTADHDGVFPIRRVDANCSKVAVFAAKPSDYWLPTCDDSVVPGRCYLGVKDSNGSVPVIDLETPPEIVDAYLGEQGGRIWVRVQDVATGQFLRAYVRIEYPHSGFTANGYSDPQGSSFEHLLPPGAYVADGDQFEHNGVGYRISRPERVAFTVTPKRDQEIILHVDTREGHARLPHDFVVPEGHQN